MHHLSLEYTHVNLFVSYSVSGLRPPPINPGGGFVVYSESGLYEKVSEQEGLHFEIK